MNAFDTLPLLAQGILLVVIVVRSLRSNAAKAAGEEKRLEARAARILRESRRLQSNQKQ